MQPGSRQLGCQEYAIKSLLMEKPSGQLYKQMFTVHLGTTGMSFRLNVGDREIQNWKLWTDRVHREGGAQSREGDLNRNPAPLSLS